MGGRGSNSGGGGGGGGSAVSASMPTLTGSAKQIAWAENIRENALETADKIVAVSDGTFNDGKGIMARQVPGEQTTYVTKSAARTVRAEVVDTFQGITSASTIIDNRARLSPNKIIDMAVLEQNTGQISAARKRRNR